MKILTKRELQLIKNLAKQTRDLYTLLHAGHDPSKNRLDSIKKDLDNLPKKLM
jgi:hypothetical protein